MGKAKIRLVALATQLGSRKISGAELAQRFNTTAQAIEKLCGVKQLFHLAPTEDIISMTVEAARKCLDHLDLLPGQINGIFGASNYTTASLMPTFTATVAAELGLTNVIVDQIGIGCGGGLQAMRAAYNQLRVDTQEGKTSCYMVVMGDKASTILDPQDFKTNILFSEGTAAIVLTNFLEYPGGYEVEKVRTTCLLGSGVNSLTVDNPHAHPQAHKLRMDGEAVYRFGATVVPHLLTLADLATLDGVYFIPHQANLRMIQAMIRRNSLENSDVYADGITSIGNTLNPSVLFGLQDALTRSLIQTGQSVLLGAFGAEMQIGAALLKPIQPIGILC